MAEVKVALVSYSPLKIGRHDTLDRITVDCIWVINNMARPRFDDLPLSPDHPKGSAWGLYGADDELGTLNLITEDVVKKAAEEIKRGLVVPLK